MASLSTPPFLFFLPLPFFSFFPPIPPPPFVEEKLGAKPRRGAQYFSSSPFPPLFPHRIEMSETFFIFFLLFFPPLPLSFFPSSGEERGPGQETLFSSLPFFFFPLPSPLSFIFQREKSRMKRKSTLSVSPFLFFLFFSPPPPRSPPQENEW